MTDERYVPAAACQDRINGKIGELMVARQLYEDLLDEAIVLNGASNGSAPELAPSEAVGAIGPGTRVAPALDLADVDDEEWNALTEYQRGKLLEMSREGSTTMHHKARSALALLGYIVDGIDDRCELTARGRKLLTRLGARLNREES